MKHTPFGPFSFYLYGVPWGGLTQLQRGRGRRAMCSPAPAISGMSGQDRALACGTIAYAAQGARLVAVAQRRFQGKPMGKQRRSKRLPLSIPVRVYGRTPNNHPFRDVTVTTMVSAHGGVFPLVAEVKRGQTISLVNSITEEERKCRVVYAEPNRRRKKTVAVEFTDDKGNNGDFWHVYPVLFAFKFRPSSD
jgi:hypothetical protein